MLLRFLVFSSNFSLISISLIRSSETEWFSTWKLFREEECWLKISFWKISGREIWKAVFELSKNPGTRYPTTYATARIQFRRESGRHRTSRQYLRRVVVSSGPPLVVSLRSLRRASFNVAFKPRRSPISCNRRWNLAWKFLFLVRRQGGREFSTQTLGERPVRYRRISRYFIRNRVGTSSRGFFPEQFLHVARNPNPD